MLVVAGILLVFLIAENTRRVKVGWVFGHSRISLVFLVLFATLVGWILGIATAFLVRRRTRRPATAQVSSSLDSRANVEDPGAL